MKTIGSLNHKEHKARKAKKGINGQIERPAS
jgi:hypothetical protein